MKKMHARWNHHQHQLQPEMFTVVSSEPILLLFLCLSEFQSDESEHGKRFVVFLTVFLFFIVFG